MLTSRPSHVPSTNWAVAPLPSTLVDSCSSCSSTHSLPTAALLLLLLLLPSPRPCDGASTFRPERLGQQNEIREKFMNRQQRRSLLAAQPICHFAMVQPCTLRELKFNWSCHEIDLGCSGAPCFMKTNTFLAAEICSSCCHPCQRDTAEW